MNLFEFFKPEAVCAICGKELGLNRFKIGETLDGRYVWKCVACAQKGGYISWDRQTGKARLMSQEETEIRSKCNTCGHIYCYTFSDLDKSIDAAKSAALSSALSAANAIGGTRLGMYAESAEADRKMERVVDYSRCPHCNSSDVRILSKEEFEQEKSRKNIAKTYSSPADELKKYKELLDSGIITQEEFDAKKKQLLNL